LRRAARSLKVTLITAPVHDDVEIEKAITALGREPGGGLVCLPDGFTRAQQGDHTIDAQVAQAFTGVAGSKIAWADTVTNLCALVGGTGTNSLGVVILKGFATPGWRWWWRIRAQHSRNRWRRFFDG
jgi:hypothetical protein